MELLTYIQSIDTQILIFINKSCENEFFNYFLPIWREKKVWIPFYIITAVIISIRLSRQAIPLLLLLALAVIMGDIISSHIIKPYFGRLRPCADASIYPLITLRAPYCGGNGSFTSSHATNHMIIAFFLMNTIGLRMGAWRWLLALWALIIGVAQVYVGVHYPTDILGGFLLGISIAFVFLHIYYKVRNVGFFTNPNEML